MQNRAVRLLNLGEVSFLRSQTIYHAVANALGEDSPDTIVLMSPREPYVCIGYHQDLEREIDLDYCRAHNLPVLRREIGGGTVYLDSQQLFYHCVFHRRRAPRRVDDVYRLFLRGPVETYRKLGVNARLAALNDIAVEDRKIGGTGAGTIDDAVVVCGSIIFDFDFETMVGLLRVPSQAFRNQVELKLGRYMTSLRGELGREVARREVVDLIAAQFGETLGVEIRPGDLTVEERNHIERLDELFVTDEWLYAIKRPPTPVRLVKIRAGVLICETSHEADGRSVRVTLSLNDGIIDAVSLAGDNGFADGQQAKIEAALAGRRLTQGENGRTSAALDGLIDNSKMAMIQACLSSIERTVKDST